MINTKIYLLLFISLFFLPLLANAQQSSISNGVNYLQAIQFSEGNWSSNIVAPYYATDEVLTTLNALGQKYTDYTNGVNWITSQSLYNVDRISRSIALLCSTDNISNLLAFQNIDNGWGIGELFSSDTLDTALALEALRAVNYSNQATISNALLYLVTNQNSDGGWGFYAGDDSNVYMTAMVLQVFDELKVTYNLTVPISNAAQYLLSHQNSDGGFGSSTSTVYETTLSFLALLGSGQGSALPLQQAIDYITATQSADGSWNEDAYSTALALRALGSYLPNLYINPGEIGISYTSVTVGSIISVSAILHNNGGLGATNAVAALIITGANGVNSTIDSTIVPSIDPGGSQALSFTWNTQGYAGKNTVCVTADPNNLIEELNKADNTGCITFNIGNLPDLIVPSSGISFSSTDGTHVTITASVYNLGESPAGSFNVGIYDGSVTNPIAIINVPGLAAGQLVTVTTLWNASSAYGYYNILVVADPDNAIKEVTKANNIGSQGYWIRPTLDLAITSADITVVPSTPLYRGEYFTLNVVVHNNGSQEAYNVLVTAQATSSEVIFDNAYVTVPGGGTAIAQINGAFQYNATSFKTDTLTVKVDPYNQFTELTKANNTASIIVPLVTNYIDLIFAWYGVNYDETYALTYSPKPTTVGQGVTLNATIYNAGTYFTTLTPQVAFYNGDPDNGGVLIGITTVTLSQSNNNGYGATASIHWPIAAPSQIIYARIDPYYQIADINRANNTTSRTISIGSTDLSISYSDLTFTSFAPIVGQPFTISATVHNNSKINATAIIHLYQGNPAPTTYLNTNAVSYTAYPPIYIASLPISVIAGTAITVTVPWVMQQGSPNIYATIDNIQPEDITNYIDHETNMSVYMKYLLQSPPDGTSSYSNFIMPLTTIGDMTGNGVPNIVTMQEQFQPYRGLSIHTYNVQKNGTLNELTQIPLLQLGSYEMIMPIPGLINNGNKRIMVTVKEIEQPSNNSIADYYAVAYDITGNTIWQTYLSTGNVKYMPNATPAFGDVNGDRITDVVIPSGSGTNGLINVLNAQTGQIIWQSPIETYQNLVSFQGTVVDLVGDGNKEVIAASDGFTVFHPDGSVW